MLLTWLEIGVEGKKDKTSFFSKSIFRNLQIIYQGYVRKYSQDINYELLKENVVKETNSCSLNEYNKTTSLSKIEIEYNISETR